MDIGFCVGLELHCKTKNELILIISFDKILQTEFENYFVLNN